LPQDWKSRSAISFAFILLSSVGSASGQTAIPPQAPYAEAAAQLQRLAEHEVSEKQLPGVSIALVDDQKIVWAQGFGFADPEKKTAATAETVYRVGSVSKLFTDIAIMQLVERGQLDLDAPVTRYLPDFHPRNPFGEPITVRELMSHRAGLVREPPVGNYFDNSEPSLAEVVKSLNTTELVYPPGTHTKYSNAGDTVAGAVLESVTREPYLQYLRQAVLAPLGLRNSSFKPEPALLRRLAKGYMWTYAGRRFRAPTFELGTGPAGNMYSTVIDQSRFLSALLAEGRGANGPILKPATLQQMFIPQGRDSGFGLGFALLSLDGFKMVGHRGGIYGFSTEVLAMPGEKIGVVVMINMDNSSEVCWHVAITALRLMLAARQGKPIPPLSIPAGIPSGAMHELAGRYEKGSDAVEIFERSGKLFIEPLGDGSRNELRERADGSILTDDRNGWGWKIIPTEGGIIANGNGSELYKRTPDMPAKPVPPEWSKLVGEYGWNYNELTIMDRNNRLTALLEMEYSPLTKVSANVWAFPPRSSYDHETLTFVLDNKGCPTQVKVGEVVFPKRSVCKPQPSWPNGMYP
jgi:CubicO group peptidase (beta-lactamase class C family)